MEFGWMVEIFRSVSESFQTGISTCGTILNDPSTFRNFLVIGGLSLEPFQASPVNDPGRVRLHSTCNPLINPEGVFRNQRRCAYLNVLDEAVSSKREPIFPWERSVSEETFFFILQILLQGCTFYRSCHNVRLMLSRELHVKSNGKQFGEHSFSLPMQWPLNRNAEARPQVMAHLPGQLSTVR